MAGRKGNMANKDNGFNIMVNLYIIRYLYRHIEKASVFMDETGQRKKTIGFDKEMGISRQRLNNIFFGRFMLTDEIKQLSGMFNIESKYFQANGKCIEIETLYEDNWKSFFNVNYGTTYKVDETDGDEEKQSKKVKKTLEDLLKANEIENKYSSDKALFRVHYYWKTGVPYTANSRITRFIAELHTIKIADWEDKEENINELKEYHSLLEKHADYLKKVIDYKEAKMNMQ